MCIYAIFAGLLSICFQNKSSFMEKELSPKFVSNRAIGNDFYEGKSQERLAQAICSHIKSIDSQYPDDKVRPSIPRLLGLEGPWGCGKSNVVAQMQKLLKDKYHFFTYDAWGHQEDLQRRSLLERLTEELVKEKLLQGKTTLKHLVEKKDGSKDLKLVEQECTWQERLQTLVARKSYSRNYTIPKLNNDSKLFALVLLVTGLIISLFNTLKLSCMSWLYLWLSLGGSLLPFILFAIFISWGGKKKWREMWAFYSTNSSSETTSYSISQSEPSEKEFREWMQDLNDSLVTGKRLVLVFDNMDRLPSDKVKQLWSSINTFFAENGYSNIWCVIPFDINHLASAFSGESKVNKEEFGDDNNQGNVTSLFIEKTFPIVYRVCSPVITDYKNVFETIFRTAFSEDIVKSDDLYGISVMYRKCNPLPNVRHIITFVNKLVVCYNQWGNEVSLKVMSLYFLYEKRILSHPEKAILEDEYFDDNSIRRQLENVSDLRTEMAVLVYGVDKRMAEQLPLKRYLLDALATGQMDNVHQYASTNSKFYEILHELIQNLDLESQYNHSIEVLNQLGKSSNADKEWSQLIEYYPIYYSNAYIPSEMSYLQMIVSNAPQSGVTKLCNYVFGEHLDLDNITGKGLWLLLSTIGKSLVSRKISYTFPSYHLKPPFFMEYLEFAKEEYDAYPVLVDNIELVSFCLDRLADGKDLSKVFELIVDDDRFDFDEIIEYLKKYIASSESTAKLLDITFVMLKILSSNDMDIEGVDTNHLFSVWNQMNLDENSSYIDIFVLLALNGINVGSLPNEQLEGVEHILLRYTSIFDLIKKYEQHNTPALENLVTYCLKNCIVDNSCPNDGLLHYVDYLDGRINITRCNIIQYLNDWGYKLLGDNDRKENIYVFFDTLTKADEVIGLDCSLGESITANFLKELESKEISDFINLSNHTFASSSYWGNVLVRLVEKHKVPTPLSSKMNEIASHLLRAVELQKLSSLPVNSVEKFLLETVEYKDVSTTVNDLITDWTNKQQTLTPLIFKYLHRFIEKTDLNGNYSGFLNYCMLNLIKDERCQNIILENQDYYSKVMQGHLDSASELKKVVEEIVDDEKYENKEFQAFLQVLLEKDKDESSKKNKK